MRILFLSTWFPYPLSQGSKIRAYYLMQSLSQEHELALISFEDVDIRPDWIEHMRRICQRVEVVSENPFIFERRKTWIGWFSLKPSSIRASYSSEMAACVKKLALEWAPDLVIALTFVAAPYALELTDVRKIVDVDNLMARMLYEEYLRAETRARRIRLWLAWRKFKHYEKWLYPKFDFCLVTSELDRRAILNFIPLKRGRVGVVPNGVDTDLNYPGLARPQPNQLIFNGSLQYQSNFDAVNFFLGQIYPAIWNQVPGVRLVVTGKTQGVPTDLLPSHDRVVFSGYLEDIRPLVAASWACVVPLRKGGGTRLKILEAMALGTPVISTPKGVEGLDVEAERHLLIADDPNKFAEKTILLLGDPEIRENLAVSAASLVQKKYGWDKIGRHLCSIVNHLSDSQMISQYD